MNVQALEQLERSISYLKPDFLRSLILVPRRQFCPGVQATHNRGALDLYDHLVLEFVDYMMH